MSDKHIIEIESADKHFVLALFDWLVSYPKVNDSTIIRFKQESQDRLRARLEGRGASLKRLMEEKQYREKVARDAISDMIELQRTYEER